jgi:FtsZ-binding cell division protein ZapB
MTASNGYHFLVPDCHYMRPGVVSTSQFTAHKPLLHNAQDHSVYFPSPHPAHNMNLSEVEVLLRLVSSMSSNELKETTAKVNREISAVKAKRTELTAENKRLIDEHPAMNKNSDAGMA